MTMLLLDAYRKVVEKKDLSYEEAFLVFKQIMSNDFESALLAGFLTALEMKGVARDELLAIVHLLCSCMTIVECKDKQAIDIVGTGGDGFSTYNISSTTALLVAACGVTVAKHGNKAVSSKSGSANLLGELGFDLDINAQQMAENLKSKGISFLFAPILHSSMRFVAPIRQSLKIKTIFNIVGPLCNPARVKRGLYGAYSKNILSLMVSVAKELKFEHAYFVHSLEGLDELSLTGENIVYKIIGGKVQKSVICPEDYGFERINMRDIIGGSVKKNTQKTIEILQGKDSPFAQMVIFNAGFALFSSGKFSSLENCFELARDTLFSKKVYSYLQEIVK